MATPINPYAPGSEEDILWRKQYGGAKPGEQTMPEVAASAGVTPAQVSAQNQKQNVDTMIGGAAMNAPKTDTPAATPTSRPIINPDGTSREAAKFGQDEIAYSTAEGSPIYKNGIAVGYVGKDGSPVYSGAGAGAQGAGALDLKPRTQEEIRQEQLKQAQAMIDATEALFQEQLTGVRERGAQALAQTSSTGVSAGVAGSPFGQAQQQKTIAATAKEEQVARQERQAEIARAFAAAEGRATDIYDREIQRYQQERQFIVDERDKENAELAAKATAARAKATATLEGLAKGGFTWNELDETAKAQIMREGNLNEWEVQAVMAANNPALNATTTIENGQLFTYYLDPRTGTPVMKATPLPPEMITAASSGVEYNLQTTLDGSLVLAPKVFDPNIDPRDQVLIYGAQGQFAKGLTPTEQMTLQEKTAERQAGEAQAIQNATDTVNIAKSTTENTKGLEESLFSTEWGAWAANLTPNSPEKQRFLADVSRLIDAKTLENLINIKARGATFGALNTEELNTIRNSASSLNFLTIRDNNGKIVGLRGSAQDVQDEIKKISDLAQKALGVAEGSIPPPTTGRIEQGGSAADLNTDAGIDSFLEGFSTGGSGSVTNASINIPKSSRLAYVNNNPGNLRLAGQAGATQGEGGFAKFPTPQAGWEALVNDIKAKQTGKTRTGLGPNSSLRDLVYVYAPPSENASANYAKQVASWLGVSENTPIKDIDTHAFAKVIAKKESSTVIS